MDDLIQRQAVFDALRARFGVDFDHGKWWSSTHVLAAIESVPPVTPQEPKVGHWIETAEEYYKAVNEYGGGVNEDTPYFVDDIACSKCLSKFSVIDNETERFECCPSCGARMNNPQESEDEG
jgi:hypothetical protein